MNEPQEVEKPGANMPRTFTPNELALPADTFTAIIDTSVTRVTLNQFSSTVEKPLLSVIDSLNNFTKVKQSLDDDCKKSLDLAFEAIDIINTLITNRLDFERLESHTLELSCASIRIRELIQKTLKMMSHRSEGKKLTLSYEVRENVPTLLLGVAISANGVLPRLTAFKIIACLASDDKCAIASCFYPVSCAV